MKSERIRCHQAPEARPWQGRILGALLTAGTLFLLGASSVARAAPSQSDEIRVEIGGLRSDRGQVICALFTSAKDFPKNGDKAIAQTKSGISQGHAVCVFRGVTAGRYAVSAFHDENSNGKMDTNFMGIPREGVGASNNARGHFGPPKFDAAAFQYSGGTLDLSITVAYL
jgi:uncharacterized protein (DUF2141 family)